MDLEATSKYEYSLSNYRIRSSAYIHIYAYFFLSMLGHLFNPLVDGSQLTHLGTSKIHLNKHFGKQAFLFGDKWILLTLVCVVERLHKKVSLETCKI